MKHSILVIATFILLASEVLSQSDFRKGYILNFGNVTTNGFIKYNGGIEDPRVCIFKTDLNTDPIEFFPEEIQAYRFENSKFYTSKIVKINDKEERRFLECMVNGIVDFYYYYDDSGDHFLVEKPDGSLQELKESDYVGTLKYIFMSSLTITSKIDRMKLDRSSIIKMAYNYHKEKGGKQVFTVYDETDMKKESKLGPLAGLNAISISVNHEMPGEVVFLEKSNFKTTIAPYIGFYFKKNMPGINQSLNFQYEVSFSKWTLNTLNIDANRYFGLVVNNDLTLTQYAFSNTGMFRFEIPKENIQPVLMFGAFGNYFFKDDFYRNYYINTNTGEPYSSDQTTDNPLMDFDYGLCIGGGLISKRTNGREIFMDIRYQYGLGLLQYVHSSNIVLNLGISIGK